MRLISPIVCVTGNPGSLDSQFASFAKEQNCTGAAESDLLANRDEAFYKIAGSVLWDICVEVYGLLNVYFTALVIKSLTNNTEVN